MSSILEFADEQKVFGPYAHRFSSIESPTHDLSTARMASRFGFGFETTGLAHERKEPSDAPQSVHLQMKESETGVDAGWQCCVGKAIG